MFSSLMLLPGSSAYLDCCYCPLFSSKGFVNISSTFSPRELLLWIFAHRAFSIIPRSGCVENHSKSGFSERVRPASTSTPCSESFKAGPLVYMSKYIQLSPFGFHIYIKELVYKQYPLSVLLQWQMVIMVIMYS